MKHNTVHLLQSHCYCDYYNRLSDTVCNSLQHSCTENNKIVKHKDKIPNNIDDGTYL